jgi:hypothetical protein
MGGAARAFDFATICRLAGLPQPDAELRFAPPRRWRFDYAWPLQKLALEVQGGLFIPGGGRHSRGPALLKEHEKLNEAAILGYRIIYVTPTQMRDGSVLDVVARALRPWLDLHGAPKEQGDV